MKKSFVALLFCLAVTSLFAQKSPAEKANAATTKMAKELGLTDSQKKSVQAIYIEMYEANAELKISNKKDKSVERAAIRRNFDKQIDAILTPYQKEKWAGNKKAKSAITKKEMERKMKNGTMTPDERATKSAGRTAERMAKQLDLSDEQKQQVFEVSKKKSLTTLALRPMMRTNREEAVAQRTKANKEFKASINEILTEEQRAKRESIKKNRMSSTKPTGSNGKRMEPGQTRPIEDKKIEVINKDENNQSNRKAAAYVKKVSPKLGLSKEQESQFSVVYLKRLSDMDLLIKDKSVTDKNKARKHILEIYETRLARFLTIEQLQKLEAMKKSKNR